MQDDVQEFLARCDRNSGALVPVKSVWRAFNSGLPAGRRGAWSRDRFLGSLIQAGLQVGSLENVAHVCGLVVPGIAWQVSDGQVKLAGVA